jgi:hypothetical protein
MRLGVFAALAVSAALAAPAVAQTPSPPAGAPTPEMTRLLQYAGTEAYFKAVSTMVLGGQKDMTPECKAPKVMGRTGFTVLRLPTFNEGSDVPVTGEWKDRIGVDNCGVAVIHNVFFRAQPDGVHSGLLLPGDDELPPAIQANAIQAAGATAAKASGCNDPTQMIPTDTKADSVIEELKPDSTGRLVGGKWRELWLFRACGKPQLVSMVFTVMADGSVRYEPKAEAPPKEPAKKDAAKPKKDAPKKDAPKKDAQ